MRPNNDAAMTADRTMAGYTDQGVEAEQKAARAPLPAPAPGNPGTGHTVDEPG